MRERPPRYRQRCMAAGRPETAKQRTPAGSRQRPRPHLYELTRSAAAFGGTSGRRKRICAGDAAEADDAVGGCDAGGGGWL